MASTAPTVRALMTASPIPINACTPTIAPKTVSNGTGTVAPNSHSIENAIAENITDTSAARPTAPITPPALGGRTLRASR